MQEEALSFFIKELIPKAYLLTPNIPEAEILAGMSISDPEDIRKAAQKIASLNCRNILIKGGHLEGDEKTDYLFCFQKDGSFEEHTFKTPTVKTNNTHGTGCTLSSAITAFLARGSNLSEAIEQACQYVHLAIEAGSEVTIGHARREREVAFYADKLCITPKYLSQISRTITRLPASQWITYYATFELVTLLNDSSKTLTEIIDLMNFGTASFFSRYARKTLGKSPSEYRQK